MGYIMECRMYCVVVVVGGVVVNYTIVVNVVGGGGDVMRGGRGLQGRRGGMHWECGDLEVTKWGKMGRGGREVKEDGLGGRVCGGDSWVEDGALGKGRVGELGCTCAAVCVELGCGVLGAADGRLWCDPGVYSCKRERRLGW